MSNKIGRQALIHNKFEFIVQDAETGQIKQTAEAYNVVLDNYFTIKLADSLSGALSYIHLGSGTGELSESRTSMFKQFAAISAQDVTTVYAYPTSYRKRKVVLQPADYVGQTIREVGFGAVTGGVLTTHALLVDSEGNQISIPKTSTDIITVYATLYCVLPETYMGGTVRKPSNPSKDGLLQWIIADGSCPGTGYWTFGVSNLQNASPLTVFNTAPLGSKYMPAASVNKATRTATYTIPRFQTTEGNGFIKSMAAGYWYDGSSWGELFVADLPNSAIWPGYVETNLSLGTGDGVTKDFDIMCPIIDEGSEVVKVGGVTKVKDVDYTIDYSAQYMAEMGDSLTRNALRLPAGSSDLVFKYETSGSDTQQEIIADLQSAKTAGGIRIKNYATTSQATVIISKSDDGVTWTEVGILTVKPSSNYQWNTYTFTPTTARYWRVYCSSSWQLSRIELLSGKKALSFITAPASPQPITISYTSRFIKKNINYVLDCVFQLQLGRYTP